VVCFLFAASLIGTVLTVSIFKTDCSHPAMTGPKTLLLVGVFPAALSFLTQFLVFGRHFFLRVVGILALLLMLLELLLSFYWGLAIGIGCND